MREIDEPTDCARRGDAVVTKPCIVLLPGLDGTGFLFEPLAEALGPWVDRIVIPYPVDRKLNYDELLWIVMKALPRGRPFLLLGESFSGPLALMAAAQRPPGLTGVVLSASFARSPQPWIPARLGFLGSALLVRIVPNCIVSLILLWKYTTPPLRALLRRARSVVAPDVLAHRLGCALRVDVTTQLADCHVPILCLRARHDLIVPARSSEIIRKINPTVTLRELPASHALLQTQPQLAAAELRAFMESLAGRTALE